jgi:poly(A) polymerase
MKLCGDWIERPATQAVCQMIEAAGHQAFFVGGCVRNTLLDKPVTDIDIATDAHPETVIRLANAHGLKPVPTGLEHGTVTVVSDHIPHEVTTFREDVETFGRHAVVAFSDDVAHDARRRDFTMNALYARRDGTLVDPLGGLADLRARHVRFIEDPDQRIREDYLRILRFFRFHAWYGDPDMGLDADGLAAVSQNIDGLAGLSHERISAEIVKLLTAPDPSPSVAAMRACGVLTAVLPGSDDRALAPLVHLEQIAGLAPDPMLRLAALAGDVDASRLRLSKAHSRRLALLSLEAVSTKSAGELGYRHGADLGVAILVLRSALLEMPFDPAEAESARQAARKRFPVTPHDLMPDYSGPALGQRLSDLEQRWIESGFTLGREDLL